MAGVVAAPPVRSAAQTEASEQVTEVAANLASGQVTIIAAHDGFVVAAIGKPFEPGDFPPVIVPLGETALVVALGAVDWVEPPTNRPILQLQSQLPRLISGLNGSAPRLSSNVSASHLEQVGLAVLDGLRNAAHKLHAPIHLPENLPLTELVIVRQPIDEKGAVWDLSYWLHQRFLEENFWDTEVDRPRYTRFFPTKQDSSRLYEIRYPPSDSSPGLLDWLSHPTGRLARSIAAAPKLAKTQQLIADGKGGKTKIAELVPLVKTALETMVPTGTPKAMAVLNSHSHHGFAWVIRPPAKAQSHQRPPGAPTLKSQPHP